MKFKKISFFKISNCISFDLNNQLGFDNEPCPRSFELVSCGCDRLPLVLRGNKLKEHYIEVLNQGRNKNIKKRVF